jgi:hypothetical protein
VAASAGVRAARSAAAATTGRRAGCALSDIWSDATRTYESVPDSAHGYAAAVFALRVGSFVHRTFFRENFATTLTTVVVLWHGQLQSNQFMRVGLFGVFALGVFVIDVSTFAVFILGLPSLCGGIRIGIFSLRFRLGLLARLIRIFLLVV